jgi:hypothetical protein
MVTLDGPGAGRRDSGAAIGYGAALHARAHTAFVKLREFYGFYPGEHSNRT